MMQQQRHTIINYIYDNTLTRFLMNFLKSFTPPNLRVIIFFYKDKKHANIFYKFLTRKLTCLTVLLIKVLKLSKTSFKSIINSCDPVRFVRFTHLNHHRYLFSVSLLTYLLTYDNISEQKKRKEKGERKKLTKHQLKAIRFIHSSNRTLPHSNAFHIKRGTHNSLIISLNMFVPGQQTDYTPQDTSIRVDFSIAFLRRNLPRSLLTFDYLYPQKDSCLSFLNTVSFLFLRESFRRARYVTRILIASFNKRSPPFHET